jgi:hypothetical protein
VIQPTTCSIRKVSAICKRSHDDHASILSLDYHYYAQDAHVMALLIQSTTIADRKWADASGHWQNTVVSFRRCRAKFQRGRGGVTSLHNRWLCLHRCCWAIWGCLDKMMWLGYSPRRSGEGTGIDAGNGSCLDLGGLTHGATASFCSKVALFLLELRSKYHSCATGLISSCL